MYIPRIELLYFEWSAVVLVLGVAWLASIRRIAWLNPLRRIVRAIAVQRTLAIITVCLVSLMASAAATAIRAPAPSVHDEFSYLLAADTFVHGRLANPQHPMWKHFETVHVIQSPTYVSKYPPAQGLLLALGMWLGHPIFGVWFGTAVAAGAICWMLQGWVPPRWALLGGLLAAVHTPIQLFWGQNYWGGAIALTGGALLFGGYARVRNRLQFGSGVALAVGVVLLANSRPFEGFVVCLPVAIALLAWLLGRERPPLLESSFRLVGPVVNVLILGGLGMAYYNHQTTGDPLRMPYQVHEATYGVSPLFLWTRPKTQPEYRHATLAAYHTGWSMDGHRQQPNIFASFAAKRGVPYFYFTPALATAMLALPWLVRRRRLRFPLFCAALVLFASLFVTWLLPHYLAPIGALFFLFAVEGLRVLRTWKRSGQAAGRWVVPGLVAVHVAAFALAFCCHATAQPTGWQWDRQRIENALSAMPGDHLVVVRYSKRHNPHQEWIYNAADIDGADVVWARSMSPEENRQLYEYFAGRRVWALYPDDGIPSLVEIRPLAQGIAAHGDANPAAGG